MKQVSNPAGRGKWSTGNVPHKGWACVGVEDLGEPGQICEMCETQDIRYIHYMEHPEYSHILEVGCVCAENMEIRISIQMDLTSLYLRENWALKDSGD